MRAPLQPRRDERHAPPPVQGWMEAKGLRFEDVTSERVPNVLILTLGGHGQMVAAELMQQCVLTGDYLPIWGLDNDAIVSRQIKTADGRDVRFPLEQFHVIADTEPRRTILNRSVVQRRRYLDSGLLSSLPVDFDNAMAGAGGGGHAVNSAIDVEQHIADVCRHLRKAILVAIGSVNRDDGDALGRSLDRIAGKEMQPLFIIMTGSLTGSFGAGAAWLMPFIVRDVVKSLGRTHGVSIPRPVIWGAFSGPYAFNGIAPRARLSYGTAFRAIEHVALNGLPDGYEFPDGSMLEPDGLPGFNRLFLIDEAFRATAEGDAGKTDEAGLIAFSRRVALTVRLLAAPETREAFLSHVANVHGDMNSAFPNLTTVALGAGGVPIEELSRLIETDVAIAHADALLTMLRAS